MILGLVLRWKGDGYRLYEWSERVKFHRNGVEIPDEHVMFPEIGCEFSHTKRIALITVLYTELM